VHLAFVSRGVEEEVTAEVELFVMHTCERGLDRTDGSSSRITVFVMNPLELIRAGDVR
jgi:hypothetical protein